MASFFQQQDSTHALECAGGNDVLRGGPGNDLLDGGGGDDWIYGGDGLDVIDGDHGNDHLIGQAGADIMLGSGASAYGSATVGSDIFIYEKMTDAGDEIWGFDTRAGDNDHIDLRTLLDNLGYVGTTPRADGFMTVTTGVTPHDAVVWIDANGGGDSFIPLLTLHDVTPAALTDSYFLFQ